MGGVAEDVLIMKAQVQKQSDEITTMRADYNESLDTIWMLLTAVLVFFMHTGFSLVECGSVRMINVQNQPIVGPLWAQPIWILLVVVLFIWSGGLPHYVAPLQ